MKNSKSEVLQIRLTELEKKVIKDKADILEMSVTDYVGITNLVR
ncbi:plasmid mobilization protein [Clostridium sp.]